MSKLWNDIRAETLLSKPVESTLDYMHVTRQEPPAVPLRDITGIEVQEQPERRHKVAIPADLRWEIWERDNFTCQHCGARRHLTIDHIYPEVRGGDLSPENLQTLCRPCNSRKSAKVLL